MKNFNGGGRELSDGQGRVRPLAGDHVIKLTSYRDPIDKNKNRLLRPLGRSRSDAREGEDRGSLRTTFGLASPLLRPYNTDSLPFQYLFNTSESRIVDEKAIKRCSGGGQTPKLVRNRYESGQEEAIMPLSSDIALDNITISSPVALQKPYCGLTKVLLPVRREKGESKVGVRESARTLEERWSVDTDLVRGRSGEAIVEARIQHRSTKDSAHSRLWKSSLDVLSSNTLLIHCYYLAHTWGILRAYTWSTDPVGIQRGYSRSIVCLTQALCKAIGLHNTYIIPTLHPHNSRISGVLKNRQDSRLPLNLLSVVPHLPDSQDKGNDGEVMHAVSFDSNAFKRLCGFQKTKDALYVKRKTRAQRGLKYVKQIAASKWPIALKSYILLMIFCVFSFPDSFGMVAQDSRLDGGMTGMALELVVKSHTTHAPLEAVMIRDVESGRTVFSDSDGQFNLDLPKSDGEIILKLEGYRPDTVDYSGYSLNTGRSVIFLKKDISEIPKLVIGDTVPPSFWTTLHAVVEHSGGRGIVSMEEFKTYPIIALDFWSVYCGPCVRSIDYIDSLQKLISTNLMLCPVYVGNASQSSKMIRDRGWDSFSITGENTNLLNAYFFNKEQLGGLVLIRDGVFVAAPDYRSLTVETIEGLVSGKISELPTKKTYLGSLHGDRKGVAE